VEARPWPEAEPPAGRVNWWVVYWLAALAVWGAVAAVFVAADTSDPSSAGELLGVLLACWAVLWALGALGLALLLLALSDPAPGWPTQNQLLARQNALLEEQNRLLEDGRA